MKKLFALMLLFTGLVSVGQQQSFDVLTYTLPKGWQQKEVNGGKELKITDNKTGEYAVVMLIRSTAATASVQQNFNFYWDQLVKPTVNISGAITMADSVPSNGWMIVSGYAPYKEGSKTGRATLLAAADGSRHAAVALMSNTKKYETSLTAIINSLELVKASKTVSTGGTTTNAGSNNGTILTGLWADYAVEKNAYGQYTTGYLRKEYQFNANGTYIFRKKNFLTSSSNIYFVSESGTYVLKGNQLTLTPTKGSAQFWSKAKSLKNDEWGKLVKTETHKLEKTTYTIELLEDLTYGNSIILKPGKATVRDGGQFNAAGDPFKFNYAFRKLESLIDNPPGFKP